MIGNIKETILFSKIKRKDKEAFIKAYDLYVDKIYRFVFFKVKSKEEAEDLTSEIFLKAWHYIQDNSVKDYKTLKALFYKIARTTVIDYYRKKINEHERSLQIVLEDQEKQFDIEDKQQDVNHKIETEIEMSRIEKKMLELKDEYREVIVLRYIEELSIGEIAKILDKSKGNVRVLIHRALKALKKLLKEENG